MRRCSLAVRTFMPIFHDIQCAHDLIPSPTQKQRASNSARYCRNRHCAAAMCPAMPSSPVSTSPSLMAWNGAGNGTTAPGIGFSFSLGV